MCAPTYIEEPTFMFTLARAVAALLLVVLASAPASAQQAPNIAAAANIRVALTEVAEAFERETGHKVVLTFGSSGNFYRQLQQGAPYQLFLSADEQFVLDLARAGKTHDRGTLYALGRLAVVAPKGSPLQTDGKLAGLRSAVAAGKIARFAIANPEHAPYGMRAVEALKHAGLWQAVRGKLVLGENASQAVQFATAGGAQGGIVAHSLVLEPGLKGRIDHALIPASWHRPLRQRMALMKNAGPVARRFYGYIQQPESRRIFVRHGFAVPGGRR
jgi:molybdate transport system substrate-binding protein